MKSVIANSEFLKLLRSKQAPIASDQRLGLHKQAQFVQQHAAIMQMQFSQIKQTHKHPIYSAERNNKTDKLLFSVKKMR